MPERAPRRRRRGPRVADESIRQYAQQLLRWQGYVLGCSHGFEMKHCMQFTVTPAGIDKVGAKP